MNCEIIYGNKIKKVLSQDDLPHWTKMMMNLHVTNQIHLLTLWLSFNSNEHFFLGNSCSCPGNKLFRKVSQIWLNQIVVILLVKSVLISQI